MVDFINLRPQRTSSDEGEVFSSLPARMNAAKAKETLLAEEATSEGETSPEKGTSPAGETSPAEKEKDAEETGDAEQTGAGEETISADGTSPGEGKDAEGASSAEGTSSAEEISAAEETGTLMQWLNEPGAGGISCGGWAGLGLVAGLLLSAAAAAISVWLRGRKKQPAQEADGRGPGGGIGDAAGGTTVGATGIGPVTVEKLHGQGARSGQQDSFFVSPAGENLGLLAIVADGMGGLSDGDKVSQAAVSAMAEGFYHAKGTPEHVLLQLTELANAAVNRILGEDGACRSGSTLTAGLIRGGAFHYLSVGDSRICLYRQGVLYQLNREHVYRNELYVRYVNGEETLAGAANHPKASGLTSFLGMGQLKYIDLPAQPVKVLPGDRFLLMSDGVYNALTAEELAAAMERGPGQSAQALDEAIRAKAYQNQDNYTAVILNC